MVAAFSPTTSSSPCGTIGGALFTLTFSGNEADFNLAAQTEPLRPGLLPRHADSLRWCPTEAVAVDHAAKAAELVDLDAHGSPPRDPQ